MVERYVLPTGVLAVVLAAGGCTHATAPCNIAAAAPTIVIWTRAFAAGHQNATAELCLTADSAGRNQECAQYELAADGTGHVVGLARGYAPTLTGRIAHGAPPGGMTVTLAMTSTAGPVMQARLHVGGHPGHCGSWMYPQLTLTANARLVVQRQ